MATQSTGNVSSRPNDAAGANGPAPALKWSVRTGCSTAAGVSTHPIACFWVFFLLLICGSFHWTPVYGSTLHLEMHKHLLNLNAADADLSDVLQRLGEVAGIDFKLPKDLHGKITLQLSDVSLETALKRILNGLNYATVYSAAVNDDTPRISIVYIYGKEKGKARTSPSTQPERRYERSIDDYEKRIKIVQRRLREVPPDSPAGRRYQKEMEHYRRLVDRLKLQK